MSRRDMAVGGTLLVLTLLSSWWAVRLGQVLPDRVDAIERRLQAIEYRFSWPNLPPITNSIATNVDITVPNLLRKSFTNLLVTNDTGWHFGWSNRLDGIHGPSEVFRYENGRVVESYAIDYSTNYAATNAP